MRCFRATDRQASVVYPIPAIRSDRFIIRIEKKMSACRHRKSPVRLKSVRKTRSLRVCRAAFAFYLLCSDESILFLSTRDRP